MVRRGHDRVGGVVGVDEAYWGGEETGAIGIGAEDNARITFAAEDNGEGIGHIRLRKIPGVSSASLHGFIREAIAPGNAVRIDGWRAYWGLQGCVHDRQIQSH
jgi:hypothetical protein